MHGHTPGQQLVLVGEHEGERILHAGDLVLGDIATVVDGFEDLDLSARFNGSPAILVDVKRAGDEEPSCCAPPSPRIAAEPMAVPPPPPREMIPWIFPSAAS